MVSVNQHRTVAVDLDRTPEPEPRRWPWPWYLPAVLGPLVVLLVGWLVLSGFTMIAWLTSPDAEFGPGLRLSWRRLRTLEPCRLSTDAPSACPRARDPLALRLLALVAVGARRYPGRLELHHLHARAGTSRVHAAAALPSGLFALSNVVSVEGRLRAQDERRRHRPGSSVGGAAVPLLYG